VLTIGRYVLIYAVELFIAGILVASVLIVYMAASKKVILPRLVLLLMTMVEWPVKTLLRGYDVDKVMINVSNKVYNKRWLRTPYGCRVVFLPQCLRASDCPAKLGSEGIECVSCGKCHMGKLKAEVEGLGMKFFIVPGSSFIKRLLKKYKPKAVLGVGCYPEVEEGMRMVGSRGLVPQCVPLLREGCINTDVDWTRLRKVVNARS
jgi:hypothetical protein